jgi:hypothetical protein
VLYAGRSPAAAPATGISKIHDTEQAALINAALHATATEGSARETTRLTGTGGAPSATPTAGAASATPLRKSS